MSKLQSFFMPAEWAPHARTILAWPSLRNPTFLTSQSITAATDEISSIAEAVAQFEPVTLIVSRERLVAAQERFRNVSCKHKVQLHPVAGNGLNIWMRDIAPTFVVSSQRSGNSSEQVPQNSPLLRGVDFNFNGWGNRHPTETCSALAQTLLHDTHIERIRASIVTEGGALEVDGEGTLLATESSMINENRNPGKTREDIETELRHQLGISKIIWVPGIRDAESTDCHIDALVRFARPGFALLSRPTGVREGVWMRVYEETRDILRRSRDARGRPIEIIDIPEPDLSRLDLGHDVLAAVENADPLSPVMSYVNYYLPNDGVIVPQFGDKEADDAAAEILQSVFGPTRQIVPVYIKELPMQGGGIHCATQQVPFHGLEEVKDGAL